MKKYWTCFFILLTGFLSSQGFAETYLEGAIKLSAVVPAKDAPEKIQPGSPMLITLVVKNIGKEKSESGKAKIRYVLTDPFDKHPDSLLYESELQELPALEPGNEISIAFKKTHTWPSIFDFIRQDYGMRQYQALVLINGQDHLIGTTHIAFSAYYYQGPSIEIPAEIK